MKSTAWENLFKRYYNEALLYVYSFCRNRALAEDVVQEAYMRAIRSINEEKDGFKFWLFKVCRNYYFDTLRKNKRLESIPDDMPSCDSASTDTYQGSEYVGGLVGETQNATIRNSVSTGFNLEKTSNTKGGLLGYGANPTIDSSWTSR